VFTITDDRITEEIVDALKRGVAIRIITDNDKSLIQQFRNAFDTLWESLTPDAE
jgi:hypothetical protein